MSKPDIRSNLMILQIKEFSSYASLHLGKTLVRYTPLLFKTGERFNRPMHVSSSLLVKFGDGHYLVTTGHTVKLHNPQNLGVFCNDDLITIGGQFRTSNLPIDDDRVDIAIAKLNSSFINEIAGHYDFFDLAKFNIDHEDIDGYNYLVVGYPLTKIKIKPKRKKIVINPFIFLTNINTNVNKYSKLGIDLRTHLILNYRERWIVNSSTKVKGRGPYPEGLSGCGIWSIPNFVTGDIDSIPFFPSSVLIEYYKEENALVSTRIPIITEVIRQVFDSEIPKSQKIKLNL